MPLDINTPIFARILGRTEHKTIHCCLSTVGVAPVIVHARLIPRRTQVFVARSAEVIRKDDLRWIIGSRVRSVCWKPVDGSGNPVSCTILWQPAEVVIERSVLLHGEDDVIDVGL